MNTNESEFENQLHALRPLAPSPALEESIARQLAAGRALATVEPRAAAIRHREIAVDRPSFFDRIFPGLRWAVAGAVAAVAVIAAVSHFSDKPAASPSTSTVAAVEPDFEPEGITRELVSAEDGGVVYENEQEPARLVRYTTLERHVWTHPLTGARLEVEIPREDIVLVPIAMQ